MRKIVFFDTETTGLIDPKHRIIEISIRICNFDTQEEITEILLRFNPERNIDAKAFAVHGINIADLKKEPLIQTALPIIKEIFEEAFLVVAHNGDYFDFPFIQMENERCGFEPIVMKTYDTMVNGTFATELGKSPSLQEYCWASGVEYDPEKAHAGDYDTLVMKDAFFNHYNNGWIKIEE